MESPPWVRHPRFPRPSNPRHRYVRMTESEIDRGALQYRAFARLSTLDSRLFNSPVAIPPLVGHNRPQV